MIMPSVLGAIASSGSTPQGGGGEELYPLPSTLGLQLWYTSRRGLTLVENEITLIEDQHSSGRDGTPNSVKPILVTNDLNGFPSIHWDTNGSGVDFTPTTSSDSWSVFLVYKHESSPVGFFRLTNGSAGFSVTNTTMTYDGSTGSAQSATLPMGAGNGFAIYEWHVNAGSCEFRQNGVLIDTLISSGVFTIDEITGQGFSSLTGKMTDLITYAQRVSELNQGIIRNTLATEYNISIT